jgi:preprotein translocase subunit YajC
MRRTLITAAAATTLALTGALEAGDVVVLRSGKMLEGDVLTVDTGSVRLRGESTETTVVRADVAAIHFDTTAAALRGEDAEPDAEPDEAPERTPGLGEPVDAEGLEITLVDASVRRVELVDLMGKTFQSGQRVLALRFSVRNTQEFARLQASTGGPFSAGMVAVADRRGRTLAPAGFGIGNRLRNAMRDGAEIAPGETAEHVAAFARPRDDSKELLCTVDLRRFGGEGTVRFRFPSP